jgi:uncharacterized caspase-like protein
MKKVILSFIFIIYALYALSQGEGQRFALLIGNSKYIKSPLTSPANDVKLIGEELKKSGFDVKIFTDLSDRDMKIQIEDFGNRLNDSKGIGLFYFAGYGLQFKGKNYLFPVDALIEKEQDIELETININRILGEMDHAKNTMNVIIIDASRKNPYSKNLKSVQSPGLAYTEVPLDTFIAFSTIPGHVSIDHKDFNSLYAIELVKALQIPKLKLEEVFKQVKKEVYKKTNGQQVSWENSNLYDDFYFWKN